VGYRARRCTRRLRPPAVVVVVIGAFAEALGCLCVLHA